MVFIEVKYISYGNMGCQVSKIEVGNVEMSKIKNDKIHNLGTISFKKYTNQKGASWLKMCCENKVGIQDSHSYLRQKVHDILFHPRYYDTK